MCSQSAVSARKLAVPDAASRLRTTSSCSATLTAGRVQVGDAHGRRRLRRQHAGGQRGELLGRDAEQHLGHLLGEDRVGPGVAAVPQDGAGLALPQERRRLLVGPVLQQPREQQVAGLEQLQVVLVLHLGGRQQPGGLEVQQRRRDDEELAGLVQVQLVAEGPQVGDELVGDLREGDLGDVELVLADQLQEEVERPLEVGQPDGEARGRRSARCPASPPRPRA